MRIQEAAFRLADLTWIHNIRKNSEHGRRAANGSNTSDGMLLDFKRDSQLAAVALTLAAATALIYRPRALLLVLLSPVFVLVVVLSPLAAHVVLSYLAAARDVPSKHGSDPLVPLLSIATPSGLEAIRIRRQWRASTSTSNAKPHGLLAPGSQKVSAALDRLIAIILDNYLNSWYKIVISPSDTSFPDAVERTIRDVLVEIREKLVKVDWASLGVTTLLPKITEHLELFTEAQQTLLSKGAGPDTAAQGGSSEAQSRKKQSSPSAVPAGEELDLLLSEKYAALLDGKGLHPAVSGASFNSRPSEEKHLRFLVERILEKVMPRREADSKAVNVMTMEIVACAVIRPIIEAISDPDLWNRMLDEKAGAAIREQCVQLTTYALFACDLMVVADAWSTSSEQHWMPTQTSQARLPGRSPVEVRPSL